MTNSRVTTLKIIKPVRSGQTTEQVVARVYELIKHEELKPGDRLPPERELSKQLGISRPSLRSALSSLISMGVLQSRQGSGTFLVDGPPALDSEPLRLLAQLHGFSFDHMFETRSVLEVGAAGLAAERATGEELANMSEEIADMFASLNDPQQFLLHDISFHRAVASASGNPTLATLVEMVSTVLYERRRETIARAHDFNEAVEWHRQIYRAIRARKPEEAREAMREHIMRAQRAFALEEQQQANREQFEQKI
ncbi:MAG TPA: FadR/GntR family transcriptional regulator [Pyrinomonadaceae bacterium]|jgi:GntR family transcriptional repressor for pyruvate dehydrogenase complex